eukprot:11202804-Lingulodinium_polyedra.AAC.1
MDGSMDGMDGMDGWVNERWIDGWDGWDGWMDADMGQIMALTNDCFPGTPLPPPTSPMSITDT